MLMNDVFDAVKDIRENYEGGRYVDRFVYDESLKALKKLRQKETQRFFLERGAVDVLSKDIARVDYSYGDLIRPPYNQCWIEDNRQSFLIETVQGSSDLSSEYFVTAFFRDSVSVQAAQFSFLSVKNKDTGEYFFSKSPVDGWYDDRADTVKLTEILFSNLWFFLLLINSPKITSQKEVKISEKLNSKRLRSNKEPLLSYSIVDLNKEEKHRHSQLSKNGGMSFHYRRGHYAILRSERYKKKGMVWRKATTVGSKKNGEVIKGYVI